MIVQSLNETRFFCLLAAVGGWPDAVAWRCYHEPSRGSPGAAAMRGLIGTMHNRGALYLQCVPGAWRSRNGRFGGWRGKRGFPTYSLSITHTGANSPYLLS